MYIVYTYIHDDALCEVPLAQKKKKGLFVVIIVNLSKAVCIFYICVRCIKVLLEQCTYRWYN